MCACRAACFSDLAVQYSGGRGDVYSCLCDFISLVWRVEEDLLVPLTTRPVASRWSECNCRIGGRSQIGAMRQSNGSNCFGWSRRSGCLQGKPTKTQVRPVQPVLGCCGQCERPDSRDWVGVPRVRKASGPDTRSRFWARPIERPGRRVDLPSTGRRWRWWNCNQRVVRRQMCVTQLQRRRPLKVDIRTTRTRIRKADPFPRTCPPTACARRPYYEARTQGVSRLGRHCQIEGQFAARLRRRRAVGEKKKGIRSMPCESLAGGHVISACRCCLGDGDTAFVGLVGRSH